MVDPSEKLSNDHAHDTQSFCLPNAIVELSEHRSERRAIGKLESLAGQLIERLAQGSAMESVISSAAAVLQSADEMKMAELNDPALACAEFDNTRNLVGDRGTDTSVYRGRNGCKGVRPPLHVLSAFAQHRIEEDRSILMTRLYRHQIHNPIFAAKAKVQSVQDQNQWTFGQAQIPRSRCELSQSSTKPPTQPLVGKTIAWSESFQCASVEQHCFESSRTRSPRLAAALFLADPPRTLALTALTTSGTEVINFRSATPRIRVPRMHARELHTD
jgi:hypothetical protein